ncbi:MAG: iron-sulfur cluster assembly protein, partial [Nitrosomonas sp.]|nr:iron-sulfur cluster assembly protein [Nitrosomonas sp.]
MTISEQQIQTILKQTIDPTTGKDYITVQAARTIRIDQNNVSIEVELGYPANSVKDNVQKQIVEALKSIPGIENIQIAVSSKIIPHSVQRGVK